MLKMVSCKGLVVYMIVKLFKIEEKKKVGNEEI